MDTLKSGQPPYNGHTVHPLPLYCPYISTSEEGITSEQWTKHLAQMCPLFRGSLYAYHGCTNAISFSPSLLSLPPSPPLPPSLLPSPSKDSYLIPYFNELFANLHTGAPVYFVIKEGVNFTNETNQDYICSSSGCNDKSLGNQIAIYARNPKE